MTDMTAEERMLAIRQLRERDLPVTQFRLEIIVRELRARRVR